MKTSHFLIVFCSFLFITNLHSGYDSFAQEYLSPEHICHSKKHSRLYIGYSTAPGIAVFDIEKANITSTIPLPSPISGMYIDEQKGLLFAGCKDNERRILAINLENEKVIKTITVGYHPSGIAKSPDSNMLFVSNRFSNDVSVVDTKSFREIRRINVVREPTAISVSPDGMLVAVTNLLPETSALDSYISAKVTLIDSKNLTVINHVELPNGSYALKDVAFSHDGNYIYVTHLIGRYNVLTSQIEKGWINTNALSIIDARTRKHFTTVLLDDIYEGAANPHGVCLSDDGKKLFVTTSGTHELFMIDREQMHERIRRSKQTKKTPQYVSQQLEPGQNISLFDNPGNIEPPSVEFEEIPNELGFLSPFRTRIPLTGKGPRHMLFINDNVYVTSYFSDALEVVSFKGGTYETDMILLGDHEAQISLERYGEQLFHDASQCFQQWQSCASCHPGNARVDGLNWDLMNDGFGNPKNTKSMLYAHATPPAMVTGIRPNAEWAVRAGFKHIQFFDIPEQEAVAVDAYLSSLTPVASPYLINGKLSRSAKKGKVIFERVSCTHCHSGPYFTNLKKYEMGIKDNYDKQNTWDTPTLIELWRTAPYMHSGKYANLEDVFKIEQHGLKEPLPEQDIKDLVEYISSL